MMFTSGEYNMSVQEYTISPINIIFSIQMCTLAGLENVQFSRFGPIIAKVLSQKIPYLKDFIKAIPEKLDKSGGETFSWPVVLSFMFYLVL